MLSELLSDVAQLVGFATHFSTMQARPTADPHCAAQHRTAYQTTARQSRGLPDLLNTYSHRLP